MTAPVEPFDALRVVVDGLGPDPDDEPGPGSFSEKLARFRAVRDDWRRAEGLGEPPPRRPSLTVIEGGRDG